MEYAISILQREIVGLNDIKDYYYRTNQDFVAKRYAFKIEKIQRAISILKAENKVQDQNYTKH